jgi:hypothetical protein
MGNYSASGGTPPDGSTLDINASGEIQVKPSTITQNSSLSNITYSANATLTADVYANNITINSGITITTNGYNFYAAGTFTNNGTINTGTFGSAGGASASGAAGVSIPTSYGGSGGGGTQAGGPGGSTTVSGGAGASTPPGSPGSSATAPTLTTSLIQSWYNNKLTYNYLSGAGGGGPGAAGSSGTGGSGIYIQANTIVAGTINTIGGGGGGTYAGGGGGGGSILLAYGSGGYTAGTYTTTGGTATGSSTTGGVGGNGIVMTFAGTPIIVAGFSYTTNSNSIKNRNSTYLYAPSGTTSTSPTTVISQTLTPQTSGLIAIRVLAKISNNTLSDVVSIGMYNGSTLLDSDSYTQEGLAGNPHLTALYYEATYTIGTPQTFSVQINAITGGTASCEIQEFTIEEIY